MQMIGIASEEILKETNVPFMPLDLLAEHLEI